MKSLSLNLFKITTLSLTLSPLLYFVSAEPCQTEPTSNAVTQLTKEGKAACACCDDFDTFINNPRHEYSYLLFYTGAASNRMNTDILFKYNNFFQEWKHTKVSFALIDVSMDKELGARYLEPNQVPTNILFKKGQPINVEHKDFDVMLKKYQGNPEGSKWLLTKYFGTDKMATNIHYAKEIYKIKKFNKIFDVESPNYDVKKNKLVKWKVVGYFPLLFDQSKVLTDFREAVWNFHNTNNTKKKTTPATNKPVDVHAIFNEDLTVHAGLSHLMTEPGKDKNGVVKQKRKNPDDNAVLRLYGMETPLENNSDENGKLIDGEKAMKYRFTGIELDYNKIHMDKWVEETERFLKEKGEYKAEKKEEL